MDLSALRTLEYANTGGMSEQDSPVLNVKRRGQDAVPAAELSR